MTSGFDDKSAVGKRLRRLSDLIDQDAKRLYKTQGLHFEQRWFGVLNQLVLHGPMTVKALSEALRITHASVSETRKSLEKAKLIRSTRDNTDRRQRPLSLTGAGEDLIRTVHPIWQALQDASTELNAEAQDIVAALDRLDAALDRKSLFDRAAARLGSSPRVRAHPSGQSR